MPFPLLDVYDCTAPLLWGTLVTGLMPSTEPLLGGVKRLPTLVRVVAGDECWLLLM